MKKILLGLLIVSCLISCQSETKKVKSYEDGSVYSVSTYKNGELVDVLYYYQTGELYAKEHYLDNKLHGPRQEYYKSGNLFGVINFDEDSITLNYFLNESGDTLAKYENGKTIMRFYNLKLKGIYCNADTSKFSVIEFDSIQGELIRFEGNLHCLNKQDSILLVKDYPNWQNAIIDYKIKLNL